MSVIVLLITAGAFVAGSFFAGFIWAVHTGQFDDTATPPVRMLQDEPGSIASEHTVRGTAHVHRR